MSAELSYLGVELKKPKTAFFELTSCEGCQLQILNKEATLIDFLNLVEVVNFREAIDEKSSDYEIAFVEGAVTRQDEVERLKEIRKNAKILVAFGSCACFGGVAQLKNRFNDLEWVKKEVYGNAPIDTQPARPLSAEVEVDLHIYGCPIKKEEVEKIVVDLVVGKKVTPPKHPVCMDCKANENICLFDLGEACLGPVTRGGCDAWCPNGRLACWGCRGPAEVANVEQLLKIMAQYNISKETMLDRLECFGGFTDYVEKIRDMDEGK